MSDAKKPYDIGYGKPPARTRFKKGQSGNPRGRVRGVRNIFTALQKLSRTKVSVTENGHRKSLTKQDAILLQLINKAASGDLKAIQQFINLTMLTEGRMPAGDTTDAFPVSKEDQEIIRQIAQKMQKKSEE